MRQRKLLGISQREFARRANCSEGTVRYHVSGFGGILVDAVLDDGSLDPDWVEVFSESVAFNRLYFGKDIMQRW
jgi:hypothetical protein